MITTAMVGIAQPAPGPDDPGGRGEDFGKSSPLGLLVLLAFLVAVVFLARSMSKHLKRVPASFDKPEDEAPADDAKTDDAGLTDGEATGSAEAKAEKATEKPEARNGAE